MHATTRAHVVVHGRVQGVGYRYSCAAIAETHHVVGWVRNLPDGSVEAVIEGAADDVNAVVAWCRRGPRHADVSSVDVRAEAPEGLSGFRIR